MSVLVWWVMLGMVICSGPWMDKKRPFIQDFLTGVLMIATWPFIMIGSLFIPKQ